MLVTIDPAAPDPLHAQIAKSIRSEIARGAVKPGMRLPAARDLASSLGVNMHTVLRAYATLRDDGVVDMRRGRGAVVTKNAPAAEINTLLAALRDAAVEHGLSLDDLKLGLERGYLS